jgi:hypothetical protein
MVRGTEVLEITDDSRVRPHTLTPFAHVEGIEVTYPVAIGSTLQARHKRALGGP